MSVVTVTIDTNLGLSCVESMFLGRVVHTPSKGLTVDSDPLVGTYSYGLIT